MTEVEDNGYLLCVKIEGKEFTIRSALHPDNVARLTNYDIRYAIKEDIRRSLYAIDTQCSSYNKEPVELTDLENTVRLLSDASVKSDINAHGLNHRFFKERKLDNISKADIENIKKSQVLLESAVKHLTNVLSEVSYLENQ